MSEDSFLPPKIKKPNIIENKEKPPFLVESFSEGKTPERNEDSFGYSRECFVIADGATDKSGRRYGGKTGGELVSRWVVEECLASELTGEELVNELNKRIGEHYQELGVSEDAKNPRFRFPCAFAAARIVGEQMIITYLGDCGIRVNGQEVYRDELEVDIVNSEARAKYIRETGDVQGSREYVFPLLLGQIKYTNNEDDPMGYGILDGVKTPQKFVKTLRLNRGDVKTLELFSDGYYVIPEGSSVRDWEEALQKAREEDPDRYLKYKAVKIKDDRTIAVVSFKH